MLHYFQSELMMDNGDTVSTVMLCYEMLAFEKCLMLYCLLIN